MTASDSARSQPPIDTTIVTNTCILCAGPMRGLPGLIVARQCAECGFIQGQHRDPTRMITSPDLVAVIKAMAEFWERLREISELAELGDDPNFTHHPDDPTFTELYEGRVAELAAHIGQLELPGGDT